MSNPTALAKNLVTLKKQLDEIKKLYTNARIDMHNSLTSTSNNSIEADGYRVTLAKPYTSKTYSRESVTNGLKSILDITDDQILDVLVASQNENEIMGDIVLRKLKN